MPTYDVTRPILHVETISERDYYKGSGILSSNSHPYQFWNHPAARHEHLPSEEREEALAVLRREIVCAGEEGLPWQWNCCSASEEDVTRHYPRLMELYSGRVEWAVKAVWDFSPYYDKPPPFETERLERRVSWHSISCSCDRIKTVRRPYSPDWVFCGSLEVHCVQAYADYLHRTVPDRTSLVGACARSLARFYSLHPPSAESIASIPPELCREIALRVKKPPHDQ